MVFFSENKEFAESDMYDEIMSRGKIRVGVNSDSKPFGFVNEKGCTRGKRPAKEIRERLKQEQNIKLMLINIFS